MSGFGVNASGGQSHTSAHGATSVKMPGWGKKDLAAYLADVQRLRGPNPYAGDDLGLDPATLALLPGGARDMSSGAYRGAQESITDQYAQPGGAGIGSFAYQAAMAGLEGERAAEIARSTRDTVLSDQQLRRQDMATRIAAGQTTAGIARNFSGTSNRQRQSGSNWSAGVSYV